MSQYFTLLLNCPLLIAAIFIAGIGGTFQYGFNVSVMTSPSDYIKQLVNQTCQQRYQLLLEPWQLSLIWSFTVSIFCLGGLVGSLLTGVLNAKYGRKQCLLLNNFLAISGAILMILSKTAMSFEMIMVARFLYGINAGVSISVHSIYMVECAPKKLQGMVGVTIAAFVSLGKFFGQLLGISELLGTEERWPWLLGFNGLAALVQLCTLPVLPESPSFLLLNRGDRQACERAMKRLWGDRDYSRDVEEMLKEREASQNVQSHSLLELLRNRSVRWPLITVLIAFSGLQLCGINAVYFYSFEVFRKAGIQEGQLRYASLGLGLCEFVTAIVLFMIIENMKKIWLLSRGFLAMSITLLLLTITGSLQALVPWMPYCTMALLFLFIISFVSGLGAVVPPLPGELFTQPFKAAAYSVACTLNWTGMFILGMVFPFLVEHLSYYCFLIFMTICFSCFLYITFNVPETSNKTTLQIMAEFELMHSKPKDPTAQMQAACDSQIIMTKF